MKVEINKVISDGLVYAKAKYIKNKIIITKEKCSDLNFEITKFDNAIKDSIKQIDELIDEKIFDDQELMTVHKLIVTDPILRSNVIKEIEKHGVNVNYAFNKVMDDFIEKFKQARTIYLQERELDLLDIKQRILGNMQTINYEKIDEDFIAVVDEMIPSLLIYYKNNLKGVIASNGGFTSHSAIICKSRDIPYVILNDNKYSFDNEDIIVDTRKMMVNVHPLSEEIEEYFKILDSKNKDKKICSFKNYDISINANVSSNDEIIKANEYSIEGIGLYRTEMIFMNLDRPMTYEEQYNIYSDAIYIAGDKSVCFRTFDIGDDKQVSYINTNRKGIDNYIKNKDIFITQIKALLNANNNDTMKIMFPMIETIDEYHYLKNWVNEIKKEIGNTNKVKIGMMLETKKAVETISTFKDVEFLSLGTNDLTKELYHINREFGQNYDVYIDDLVGVLRDVVKHCNMFNIELSICGELASVKEVVGKLYDIGIRNFSVSVSSAKTLEFAIKEKLCI